MAYIIYNQCNIYPQSPIVHRLNGNTKVDRERGNLRTKIFFVHFISLYTNCFPRQNKVIGGLEIVSAFGRVYDCGVGTYGRELPPK